MNSTYVPSWLGVGLLAGSLLTLNAAPAEPPSLTAEYFSVLRSGDAHGLRQALDHGAPVNARDAAGQTPLMLAAVYGDTACLRLLLERGAEVNATNAAGATALMRAAYDSEKAGLLVARGAEVNRASALGNTALILAARPGDSHRTVDLLLRHGAEVNATNAWGATALMAAAAGGDEASVRLLLAHGAQASAQPGIGRESFILGGGRSALMWAAYRGDMRILERLLEAGAEVNSEGALGTALSQAAWADHTEAARRLLEKGANVNQMTHIDGFTPLHWAASSECGDATLVKLLLDRGADPNCEGGDPVDAFQTVPQTPLMLAGRRGQTPILAAVRAAGATNGTPDEIRALPARARSESELAGSAVLRSAVAMALPPLQETSIKSKDVFVRHESHQDCVSCHQQYLPLAAIGLAKKHQIPVDVAAERDLVKMVQGRDLNNPEVDWEPLFHPEPVHSRGYFLFGYAADNLPADELTDSSVHHLAVIQGKNGQWYNNLPRPPIQSGDISATALAIQGLQRYPLPGRKAEFAKRVALARRWLWSAKPDNHDARIYQLLGLAWAGETPTRLAPLAKALLAEQRADGGWAQLPGLSSDAYATGQALYALSIAAGLPQSHAALEHGRQFLLSTQLEDGTWYVRRRAFPFQPTMVGNGFPHGKDSWISAAATSWAAMALSLPVDNEVAYRSR